MHELQRAFRALRATPIVTAAAILSLALGIGANTAVFSIFNGLLLRTLPIRDPNRLVVITDATTTSGQTWTYPVWEQIHQTAGLLEGSAAWWSTSFNLAWSDDMQLVDGLCASGSFFEVLGVPALMGRTFLESDDRRGGGPNGPVAVISYAFWQDRFGGTADVVGRSLVTNNVSFAIVGVMPRGFLGPEPGRKFDVIIPIAYEPVVNDVNRLDSRDIPWLTIVARLKLGQSLEGTTAALRALQPSIRAATLPDVSQVFLDQYLKSPFALQRAATGVSPLRRRYEQPVVAVLVFAVIVQLIVCANIAHFLLARTAARRHELSVRRALGASTFRLMHHLMSESVVLTGIGTGIGLVFTTSGTRWLLRQLSTSAGPVMLDVRPDWHMLAFTSTITLGTALMSGVGPCLSARHVPPIETLKAHGRGVSGRFALTEALMIAHVGFSLALIFAASLLVRSFVSLATRPLGFVPDRLLVVTMTSKNANIDRSHWLPVYARVQAACLAVAGVTDASLSVVVPAGSRVIRMPVDVPGGVPLPASDRIVSGNVVSSRWFSTFRIPMVSGRDFSDQDRQQTPRVIIVNQAFAQKFLGGASPLQRTVILPSLLSPPHANPPLEVVGVVGNAVWRDLREPMGPTVYLPLWQRDEPLVLRALGSITLTVRTHSESPALLTKSLAAAIAGVDPDLMLSARPLVDQLTGSVGPERLGAAVAACFGGLALLLAGIGLYGVTSAAVTWRRTEIGIRMALGAASGRVLQLILARVAFLVGAGILVGLVLSVWVSTFVASLIYEIEPRDPLTFVGTSVALGAVCGLAGWFPAWRATRIDPAELLREG